MANCRASDQKLKNAYIPTSLEELLNQVLKSRGQSYSEWVRSMINRCAAERLPESQGDVKKIIPGEVSALAQEALELQGQFYLTLSAKQTDPAERRRYRQMAAPYLNSAAFFSDVLEERRRRAHILESGQRAARHRVKSAVSPPTESSSSTKEAPSG